MPCIESVRTRELPKQEASSFRSKGLLYRLRAKFLITPNNIADFVKPIVDFIDQTKPDYIIANDRGGRLTAVATHVLYQELHGRLPTQDHVIHFRRMSSEMPYETIREQLRTDIEPMLLINKSPTILVVDDYVNTGKTRSLVIKALNELSEGKIRMFYGVMRGAKADISADRKSLAISSWRDRQNVIGIEYSKASPVARRIPSTKAIHYREQIVHNVRAFGKQILTSGRH